MLRVSTSPQLLPAVLQLWVEIPWYARTAGELAFEVSELSDSNTACIPPPDVCEPYNETLSSSCTAERYKYSQVASTKTEKKERGLSPYLVADQGEERRLGPVHRSLVVPSPAVYV